MLISHSRLDIPSAAFDKGKPLCLDVGAPIIEVLQTSTTPGHAAPGYDVDGTLLRIGPDRIGKRQKISFSLLVDGPHPAITSHPSPLNDVQIRKQPDEPRPWTAAAGTW